MPSGIYPKEKRRGMFEKGHKGIRNSGNFKKGLIPWIKTHGHSEISRKSMSKSHTGLKRSEETKKKIGIASRKRKHLESSKQKIREWVVAHPNKKFKDTTIEVKMEAELIKRGINFKKQVPLCKTTVVDFCIPNTNTAIYCDGCYWHGCPLCFPDDKFKRGEKDRKKDEILRLNGFKVYRFWEHDINKSVSACIDSIGLW